MLTTSCSPHNNHFRQKMHQGTESSETQVPDISISEIQERMVSGLARVTSEKPLWPGCWRTRLKTELKCVAEI